MFLPLWHSLFFTDLAHFCMQDLWPKRKDIGYSKLHYKAVLSPKLRLNVAFTT